MPLIESLDEIEHGFFLLIGIILNCGSACQNNAPPAESDKEGFQSFVSRLRILELPLTLNCNAVVSKIDKESKHATFVPVNHHVIGNISAGQETAISLVLCAFGDGSAFPCLFSFGPEGQKLDSLCLHDACAKETRLERKSQLRITEEHFITITDTSGYFSYMGHGSEYIRSIDSTIISQTMFIVNEEGKITQEKVVR